MWAWEGRRDKIRDSSNKQWLPGGMPTRTLRCSSCADDRLALREFAASCYDQIQATLAQLVERLIRNQIKRPTQDNPSHKINHFFCIGLGCPLLSSYPAQNLAQREIW